MKFKNASKTIAALIAAALFANSILAAGTDWSVAVVDSTMKRYPTAESLKGWGYAKSLYLYGEYLVYLRTKDKKYLQHVKDWIDLHIDDKGTINRSITALDYMLPGNLCLILYKETKEAKYKGCADMVRRAFD
ncbi:MAG TPA: glycoside hydrolase family 88 protein, partial [Pyrinomonadaceae bacterium]|nr:glycoside hydrolase family 88 protein [Pyrinomonadaceae bacterium]